MGGVGARQGVGVLGPSVAAVGGQPWEGRSTWLEEGAHVAQEGHAARGRPGTHAAPAEPPVGEARSRRKRQGAVVAVHLAAEAAWASAAAALAAGAEQRGAHNPRAAAAGA